MSKPNTSQIASKLPKTWQDWINTNLARSVNPINLYSEMRRRGFGQGQIQSGLGDKFPDVIPDKFGCDTSGRIFDYGRVAHCAITKRDHPAIRRLPTQKAQIYVWNDFLNSAECEEMRRLTNTNLKASTITSGKNDYGDAFRTSRTCHLNDLDSKFVTEIDNKISKALGISLDWSEQIQAQKYEIGQEFKAHTDYFEPGSDEYDEFCKTLGQRTWTFMVYLNDVEDGGATRFRKLDKIFRPSEGQAVIWNSLTEQGDPNPLTIHHGMKVRQGEKYVITKWFRDKGEGPMIRADSENA